MNEPPRHVRLLFTGIGSPSTPAVLEAIRCASRYRVTIIGTDMNMLAGNMYLPDVERRFMLPEANASLAYIDAVCELIERERADLYFSTCEEEYIWIARYRSRLEAVGCRVFLPPYDALAVSYDKRRTYEILAARGYAHPLIPTVYHPSGQDPDAIYDRFGGRVIIKAVDRSGARELYVPDSREEFRLQFDRASRSPVDFIVQEFLTGAEWNVTMLHDEGGRLIYAVPRRKLETRRIKSSTLAAVIEDNDVIRAAAVDAVERIGLCPGFNNVELIEVDGRPYLIEINGGRIAAQDQNILAAGINMMEDMFDILYEIPVTPVTDYRRGLVSLKIRLDVITTVESLARPALGVTTR